MSYEHLEIKGKKVLIHDLLLKKLKRVQVMQNSNWDCVMIICGRERAGKSTLAMLIGYILSNGNLKLNNIASNTEDAINKLENLPDKSVLIIDEGSLMFSSKDSLKKEQKQLIKILNVIGAKNMVLIIVIPDFFDLNHYIAVQRSKFLIRVYTTKDLVRGKFQYFSKKKKKILYEYGKKHFGSYSFPKSDFIGRFPKFELFGEDYLKLKKKSLMSVLKDEDTHISDRHYKDILHKSAAFYILHEKKIMTNKKLAEIIEGLTGKNLHQTVIGKAINDFKRKIEKDKEDEEKSAKIKEALRKLKES